MNQIMPGFFISDQDQAKSAIILDRNKITHIVQANGAENPPFPDKYKYHIIVMDDYETSDVLAHFPATFKFIDEALKSGGVVLVHCAAGISRSSSLAISYLMQAKQMEVEQAFELVKAARSIVRPNFGFTQQLHLWKDMNYALEGETQPHRTYRTFQTMNKASLAPRGDASITDSIYVAPDPQINPPTPQIDTYTCAHCSRVLFTEENLLPHIRDHYFASKRHLYGRNKECPVYFIEPIAWIKDANHMEGKMTCPECKENLGEWSWKQGHCSCGIRMFMTPSFAVHKTKITKIPGKKETQEQSQPEKSHS